jgi:hypothetical protein
VGLGAWVGLPILGAVLLVALLAVSARLPLPAGRPIPERPSGEASFPRPSGTSRPSPSSICETMNGNWLQIDLTELHVSATTASVF